MKSIEEKLKLLRSLKPGEDWVAKTRVELLSKVEESQARESAPFQGEVFGLRLRRFLASKTCRLPSAALSAALAVFLLVGTAVSAAQSSMPGDFLYPVKIASESVVLSIAPESEKAKIEVEQAGRRLEELAEISQKLSDVEQQKKVEQLVASFEEKMKKANEHLEKIRSKEEPKKVKTAKVVNIQSEKYADVLSKVAESLPAPVKEKVSDKIAKAIDSAEKVSVSSLMVIVETDGKSEETAAQVKKHIEKAEAKVENVLKSKAAGENASSETASSSEEGGREKPEALENLTDGTASASSEKESLDGGSAAEIVDKAQKSDSLEAEEGSGTGAAEKGNITSAEEAKKEIEKAKESFEKDDLLGALNSAVRAESIAEKAKVKFEVMPIPVYNGSGLIEKGGDGKEKSKELEGESAPAPAAVERSGK